MCRTFFLFSSIACIVNDSTKVGNILNEYYINVTKDIGPYDAIKDQDTYEDIVEPHKTNKSVMFIRDNIVNEGFAFKPISDDVILKLLKNVKSNKATGYDTIPPKAIKIGEDQLCLPITYLVNKSIETCTFPENLKHAEVTPIFKKDDKLQKSRFRDNVLR